MFSVMSHFNIKKVNYSKIDINTRTLRQSSFIIAQIFCSNVLSSSGCSYVGCLLQRDNNDEDTTSIVSDLIGTNTLNHYLLGVFTPYFW